MLVICRFCFIPLQTRQKQDFFPVWQWRRCSDENSWNIHHTSSSLRSVTEHTVRQTTTPLSSPRCSSTLTHFPAYSFNKCLRQRLAHILYNCCVCGVVAAVAVAVVGVVIAGEQASPHATNDAVGMFEQLMYNIIMDLREYVCA